MLDYVVVFTKGGIILWDFNSSDFTYNTCINNVIRTIVLEERNTDYKYFENQNLAVQFKLDNELDLVYAVVFQKVIKLNYVEALLEDMQRKFKRMFVEMLVSVQRLCTSYDFSKEYQLTLSSVEKSANKVNMAPKQMRSFNESTKSKKNVASMYDETKTEKEKKVVIQETSKQQQASATTVNFILENRKKLKEKLAGKKSPTECKSTSLEKAGKKPRVWDLGGSAKDAVVLDRSKDQPQDVQYKNIQNDHVGALSALKRPVEFWDDWLVHLTVLKLAYETRKQWELSLVADDVPSFTSLRDFLETRARSLEMVPAAANARTTAKNVLHTTCNQLVPKNHPSSKTAKTTSYTYCKGEHRIYTCEKFNQLDARAKLSTIKSDGACLNCLSKGHVFANCRSSPSCPICQRRHHTLLHAGLNTNEAAPAMQNAVQNNVTSHNAGAERVVLLGTADILLQDNSGRCQPARALFDNGSHASFITEPCVQRLRLPRNTSSDCVTGIGSVQGGRTKGEVKLSIAPKSLISKFHVSTLILSKITNDLPTNALSESRWPHVSGLPLADPNYFKPGPIDVLISMDEMDKFLLDGLKKGENGTPMAQNTVFGWVLFGNATPPQIKPRVISTHYCNTQLTDLLAKFWELEELPPRKFYTPEELYCEKLFDDTTQRATDGRFIVRLPLKPEVLIGESRNAAVRVTQTFTKSTANL
ncbi:uncharacterized protein SrpRalpha isoform X1 [Eurosta solidaginis]|uniref:uncharacterized protein SrpRalpha isoform X1 n=1 Tax=Eurosta solidaginis TaxID=178769 RepID=UPI0035306C93